MGYPKSSGRSSLGMIFNIDLHGDLRSCSKRRRYTVMTQTPRRSRPPPLGMWPWCGFSEPWRRMRVNPSPSFPASP